MLMNLLNKRGKVEKQTREQKDTKTIPCSKWAVNQIAAILGSPVWRDNDILD